MKRRIISLILALAMLAGVLPQITVTTEAESVGEYQEIFVGLARIGNGEYSAENILQNFSSNSYANSIPGFYMWEQGCCCDNYVNDDGNWVYKAEGRQMEIRITVAENPTLKAIAAGGHAYFEIYWRQDSRDYPKGWSYVNHWVHTTLTISNAKDIREENGKNVGSSLEKYTSTDEDERKSIRYYGTLTENTIINLYYDTHSHRGSHEKHGITEAYLRIWDEENPTMTFTSDVSSDVTTEGYKSYIKLGTDSSDPDVMYNDDHATVANSQYTDATFSFTEPVHSAYTVNLSSIEVTETEELRAARSVMETKQSEMTTAQNAVDANSKNMIAAEKNLEDALELKDNLAALIPDAVAIQESYSSVTNSYPKANGYVAAYESSYGTSLLTAEAIKELSDEESAAYDTASSRYLLSKAMIENKGAKAAIAAVAAAKYSEEIAELSTAYAKFTAAKQNAGESLTDFLTRAVNAIYNDSGYEAAYNNYSEKAESLNTKLEAAKAAYNTARKNYNTLLSVEQVKAMADLPIAEPLSNMSSQDLFTNTLGTGYVGMGQNRALALYKANMYEDGNMILNSYSYADTSATQVGTIVPFFQSGTYIYDLYYRYRALRGDYNGGNRISTNSLSKLIEKIRLADFHDAAGNPLVIDYNGYDVFTSMYITVDAEPPTYTKTGNGITPDILTGVTLRKGNYIEFIVAFSEIVKPAPGLSYGNTYLLFNNGERAYYYTTLNNGKQWVFRYWVGSGKSIETSLWKVIALTNTALTDVSYSYKGYGSNAAAYGIKNGKVNTATTSFYIDARAIVDLAGNRMTERANEDARTNSSQIESAIDWASLSIDNTAPTISTDYVPYSISTSLATDEEYGQASKIAVTATDADIATPTYDPDRSVTSRPSKGIFRPDNTTSASSSASSAAGMVYYVWSQDPTPPSTGTNYEVIKRFSLVGWDEKAVELTKDSSSPYYAWADLTLKTTNNLSEITPPDEAMTPEGSGTWYLHIWTADMTWDSARQLLQYNMIKSTKYNSGYNLSSALQKKIQMTESNYSSVKTSNPTGTYSYDDAWKAVRASYYSTVYTKTYRDWLSESGKDIYSDDAEVYARNQAMLQAGVYANWDMSLFRSNDSNWTQKTVSIKLDNTLPTVSLDFDSVEGNNTAFIRMKFTVSDTFSGVDATVDDTTSLTKLAYQWVKKPDGAGDTRPAGTKTLNPIDWVYVDADSFIEDNNGAIEVTAVTLNHVSNDGEYYLSVLAVDKVGNQSIVHSEETINYNSTVKISCDFSQQETEAAFYTSVTPTVHVSNGAIKEVRYVVTNSADRPEDGDFAVIESNGGTDETETSKWYTFPAMGSDKTDGAWYVHLLVYENTIEETDPIYYSKAYRLDNTAPSVYANPSGSGISKTEYNVKIQVSDALSGVADGTLCYQWTYDLDEVNEENWTALEDNLITKAIEDKSENGEYYLHIRVADKLGNLRDFVSQRFRFKIDEPVAPPTEPVESHLISVYSETEGEGEDKTEKLYAIAELKLDNVADKAGYYFSLSGDCGETWASWIPYSSMVELALPAAVSELAKDALQVKYRTPDGQISGASVIVTDTLENSDGIWATATLESLNAKKPGTELVLLMESGEGVTVTVNTEKNVAGLEITGDEDGDFTVMKNGVYNFTLTKTVGESKKTADFCVVVDIYDDEMPEGYATYSTVAPTSNNVYATLETNETVTVTKIEVLDEGGEVTATKPGADKYVFKENGRVRFCFQDAAGNENTAIAEVENIERSAPDIEIVSMFADGSGNEYKYVTDTSGKELAHGVYLRLQKKEGGNGKSFTIVRGDKSGTMEITSNGTYSFAVIDENGNFAEKTFNVDCIIEEEITPVVTYAYESEDNIQFVPGEVYRNDNVIVTISFPVPSDGREVYLGKTYVSSATPLTQEGGCYVLRQKYQVNGSKTMYFNDGIGGVISVPITVTGIDKNRPEISLNSESYILRLPRDDSVYDEDDFASLLGGYAATDADTPNGIRVTITNTDGSAITFDKNTSGVYTVRYTAIDSAGNESYVDQTVYAIPADDIFVLADDAALMNSGNNTAIVQTNHVTFTVDEEQMQQMFYRGQVAYNRSMKYDVYYVSGLYREGQLKYIATKLTGDELMNNEYTVTFERTGWYTIIIRNQERSRVYTSFFVSSVVD